MLATFAPRFIDAKLFWIQAQYDSFVLQFILRLPCITKGKTGPYSYTFEKCKPHQLLPMDFTRSVLLEQVLYPLVKQGHSVWSNACVWHSVISENTIYFSDNQKASVQGKNITIQEALESYVFDNEKINEIDAYPWPYNRGCAF